MEFFVKIKGLRSYFRVMAHFKKSRRGHYLLFVDDVTSIIEKNFYQQDKNKRFSLICLQPSFHQIGNDAFFQQLHDIEKQK